MHPVGMYAGIPRIEIVVQPNTNTEEKKFKIMFI